MNGKKQGDLDVDVNAIETKCLSAFEQLATLRYGTSGYKEVRGQVVRRERVGMC